MYGNSMLGIENPCGEGPYYRGALLVGLKTIVPYLQEGGQMTNVEPTTPIQMVNNCTCILKLKFIYQFVTTEDSRW